VHLPQTYAACEEKQCHVRDGWCIPRRGVGQ
jgi:hypothetical protein